MIIIDNLDRIDPDHIFRILNVFSAQMEFNKSTGLDNKFGFDKIILVCDLHNIRNIFKNRYGADVDFNGYINKFYSTDIFHYGNYGNMVSVSNRLILNAPVNLNGELLKFSGLTYRSGLGLSDLLAILIFRNIVSLRQVLNSLSSAMYVKSMNIKLNGIFTPIVGVSPILEMKLLARILGGYVQLKEAVLALQEHEISLRNYENYINVLVYFRFRDIHKFEVYNGTFQRMLGSKLLTVQLISSYDHIQSIQITTDYPEQGRRPYQPEVADYYILYLKIIEDLFQEKVIE